MREPSASHSRSIKVSSFVMWEQELQAQYIYSIIPISTYFYVFEFDCKSTNNNPSGKKYFLAHTFPFIPMLFRNGIKMQLDAICIKLHLIASNYKSIGAVFFQTELFLNGDDHIQFLPGEELDFRCVLAANTLGTQHR